MNKLYITKGRNKWEACADRNYNVLKCDYKIIQNGYILPLKVCEYSPVIVGTPFEGGVLSEERKFISGHKRNDMKIFHFAMNKGYKFDTCPIIDNRRVIYGGILFDVFGHCITETLCRCWYLYECDEDIPIVFLSKNLNGVAPQYFWDIIDLLEIDKNRIVILKEITQYREIIVPDQSLIMFQGFNSRLSNVYEMMMRNAKKYSQVCHKKVYLSRNMFDRADCFNEQWFEHFYKERGYEIIYPETLTLAEQVAIVSQAKQIVCTGGTLSHLLLFASKECKATILLRCNEPGALIAQFLINQFKDISVNWVDISYNILPTTHASGIFYVRPTDDFVNYLNTENIPYFEEELQRDSEKELWTYIKTYANWYARNAYAYKRLKNLDFFSVINNMSEVINGRTLTRNQMATPDKNVQVQELLKKVDALETQNLIHKREMALVHKMLVDDSESRDEKLSKLDSKLIRPFITWKMHVAYSGWLDSLVEGMEITTQEYSGNRLEALTINLINSKNLNLRYRVCTEKNGWEPEVEMQNVAGSVGKSNAILAVQINLSDNTKYDVLYRVGYSDQWSKWYRGGEKTDYKQFPLLERIELKLEEV